MRLLLAVLLLSGCQGMGYKTGYASYNKKYIERQEKVHVPSYSWGFLKGWEAAKLEHARSMKSSYNGIKTTPRDDFDK